MSRKWVVHAYNTVAVICALQSDRLNLNVFIAKELLPREKEADCWQLILRKTRDTFTGCWFNPFPIKALKYLRINHVFFQYEIIINVIVSSSRFIWIPMLLGYVIKMWHQQARFEKSWPPFCRFVNSTIFYHCYGNRKCRWNVRHIMHILQYHHICFKYQNWWF